MCVRKVMTFETRKRGNWVNQFKNHCIRRYSLLTKISTLENEVRSAPGSLPSLKTIGIDEIATDMWQTTE